MLAARVLLPGDEAEVSAFLESRPAETMFLRSNLAAAGLLDAGERFQGTWAAAFDGPRMVGVASLFWNGMLVVAAAEGLDAAVLAAAAGAPRPIAGLIGPWDQVTLARRVLGLADQPTRMANKEDLFLLDLESLRVPPAAGRTVRRAEAADVPILTRWLHAYGIETLGDPPDADEAPARRSIEDQLALRRIWVVLEDGAPVAMSMFNAHTGDSVQVGGVYTPPAARGRGLARTVVAGSLLDARTEGARHAILFTGAENEPARRAYLALGFIIVGDYGLVFFDRG